MTTCFFCGVYCDPEDPETWKQQTVWVGGPKKNSSVLAESTNKLAHSACIKKAKAGHAPDQPEITF